MARYDREVIEIAIEIALRVDVLRNDGDIGEVDELTRQRLAERDLDNVVANCTRA
jgi:hypothetical protein